MHKGDGHKMKDPKLQIHVLYVKGLVEIACVGTYLVVRVTRDYRLTWRMKKAWLPVLICRNIWSHRNGRVWSRTRMQSSEWCCSRTRWELDQDPDDRAGMDNCLD